MGTIAKICGVVTVFGALNWASLGLFGTDVADKVFGTHSSGGAHTMMVVVAMGAMFMLAIVAKPKKEN